MKGVAPDHAHRDRTPRLDRHAPQHQPAHAFDRGLDVIFLAGRNPAGGQDQIVGRAAGCKACASDARSSRRMPRSLCSQPSLASIASNMKRLESKIAGATAAARRYQFVAGGKHRDADASFHIQMPQPERGRERDILRPQPAARRDAECPIATSSPAGRTLAPGRNPAAE